MDKFSDLLSNIKDGLYCLVAQAAEGITVADLDKMDRMGLSIDRDLLAQSRDYHQVKTTEDFKQK